MAALTAGATAPDFKLKAIDGSIFSLHQALQEGPVVAAFFKVSCPVCQYSFPFFERLYKLHQQQKLSFVGISQDNARDSTAFLKQYGVTFPVLLDDPSSYAVSSSYGLTNVPSLFLIGEDGKIEISMVGWIKKDVEAVNAKLAGKKHISPIALFKPADDVSDFRAG
jgi:peroxiredoxin